MENNDNVVDPYIDKYINLLLDEVKEYQLSNRSKNILNFVVYLLLNKDFQFVSKSMRIGLGMPINGFQGEDEIEVWKKEFKENVKRYRLGEVIDSRIKFMVDEIEKKMGGVLADSEKKFEGALIIDMCTDAVSMVAQFMLEFLELKDTKNIAYWLKILEKLLLFNPPKNLLTLLQSWGKISGNQSLFFELRKDRLNIAIILYPDATFEDLERLIESNRKSIAKQIKELKDYSRKNQVEAKDIKRDYLIYKTYNSEWDKKDEELYIKRKDYKVLEEANNSTGKKEWRATKKLKWGSIRKTVSRMRIRIKKTTPQNKDKLANFLAPFNPPSESVAPKYPS